MYDFLKILLMTDPAPAPPPAFYSSVPPLLPPRFEAYLSPATTPAPSEPPHNPPPSLPLSPLPLFPSPRSPENEPPSPASAPPQELLSPPSGPSPSWRVPYCVASRFLSATPTSSASCMLFDGKAENRSLASPLGCLPAPFEVWMERAQGGSEVLPIVGKYLPLEVAAVGCGQG